MEDTVARNQPTPSWMSHLSVIMFSTINHLSIEAGMSHTVLSNDT
jgi:hypothetical protein